MYYLLSLCVGCSIGFVAGIVFGKKTAELEHLAYVMATNAYVKRCTEKAQEIERLMIERQRFGQYPFDVANTMPNPESETKH